MKLSLGATAGLTFCAVAGVLFTASGSAVTLRARAAAALPVSAANAPSGVPAFIPFGLAAPRRVNDALRQTAPAARINPKDHAVLVYVPAGRFPMGDADIPDNPPHTVDISGFYIYKNDVTVAMYRAFCTDTGREMPTAPTWGWKDDNPIVNVTWDDARAYCAWARGRLPTEAEWEKAARGEKGLKYPWGNQFDPTRLWSSSKVDGDAGSTHAVGGFPSGASPYGALDMAGNVWQWCEDGYDEKFMTTRSASERNPVNEDPEGRRVLRGGSCYISTPLAFRTAFRFAYQSSKKGMYAGFRAVIDTP